MMRKRSLLYPLCGVLLLCSGCATTAQENTAPDYRVSRDTVYVRPAGPLTEKLVTATVEEEPFVREVVTAGTIEPISTQYAFIAPPFAGRVVEAYVRLGQRVNAHTPLFSIVSPDFVAAQKEYYQARSERDLALKERDRKQDLLRNGVAAQKELEEAESLLSIAEKEFENARAALTVYHVDPEDMVLGQPLIIRSPIAGEVIETRLVTGEYIRDDAEPVAVVADLSKVWIAAQVKEKDLRLVKEEGELHVEVPAWPDELLTGRVYHIDEAVDADTRSLRVLSICDNSRGLLKIGMYVNVHFAEQAVMQTVVPETALLQDQRHSYVLTSLQEGVFVRTPVEVELTRDGKAYVSSGLKKGDVVVSQGGYYLK